MYQMCHVKFCAFVFQGDINYAEERVQRMLVNYHRAFLDVQNIIKDKDGTLPDFWLPLMKDWLLRKSVALVLRILWSRLALCS